VSELIDRQTRTWAVVAVVAGVALSIGLELWETPGMSAAEIGLELLSTLPVVMTSVGLALLFRVAGRQQEEQRTLVGELEVARVQGQRWRSEARSLLNGLGEAIDVQFSRWNLTEAEREVALLLLKGLSLKEIAAGTVRESGLGDVEMQVRWRFVEETESHPEAFTFVETVFPFQRDRHLIGTQDREYKVGVGSTRGFACGTGTFRLSGEYSGEEGKVDAGEYAFEYLKRLSPTWRVFAAIEGTQVDEVELITEVQWHFHRRAFLKVNNGLGLTTNATGLAPEIGVMISF